MVKTTRTSGVADSSSTGKEPCNDNCNYDRPPDTLRTELAASLKIPTLQRVVSPSESRLVEQVTSELASHGVIELLHEYEPSHTTSKVDRGADGRDDLYFPYDLGPFTVDAVRETILDFDPLESGLSAFAKAFQRAHPQAVFTKGRIHVPYCAWPMPAFTIRTPSSPRTPLNFRTPEGRIYRWKRQPFDMPLAAPAGQAYVDQ